MKRGSPRSFLLQSGCSMSKRAVSLSILALAAFTAAMPADAGTPDRDAAMFSSIKGTWTGPGEIVAGKYKGTKFTCNLTGETPSGTVGMKLDGACRVGVFTQPMSASVVRRGAGYRGLFLDGAAGKGLDITGGSVSGQRAVFSINRKELKGAMLAKLNGSDAMNVTISVRVDNRLVPVIGMNLKRVDSSATGSVSAD